jgi:hypothetical protein
MGMSEMASEPAPRQADPTYYGYAGWGRQLDDTPEMSGHNHGRCDSTCPSDAHGCLRCRACVAERARDADEETDHA